MKDIYSVLNKLDILALNRLTEENTKKHYSEAEKRQITISQNAQSVSTKAEQTDSTQQESIEPIFGQNWAKIRNNLELMDRLSSIGENDELASAEELATIKETKTIVFESEEKDTVYTKRMFDEIAPLADEFEKTEPQAEENNSEKIQTEIERRAEELYKKLSQLAERSDTKDNSPSLIPKTNDKFMNAT